LIRSICIQYICIYLYRIHPICIYLGIKYDVSIWIRFTLSVSNTLQGFIDRFDQESPVCIWVSNTLYLSVSNSPCMYLGIKYSVSKILPVCIWVSNTLYLSVSNSPYLYPTHCRAVLIDSIKKVLLQCPYPPSELQGSLTKDLLQCACPPRALQGSP